jgi:hypothetical protein
MSGFLWLPSYGFACQRPKARDEPVRAVSVAALEIPIRSSFPSWRRSSSVPSCSASRPSTSCSSSSVGSRDPFARPLLCLELTHGRNLALCRVRQHRLTQVISRARDIHLPEAAASQTSRSAANHRDAVMTSHLEFGKRSSGDSTPRTAAQADSRAKAQPRGGICPSLLIGIIFC